MKKIGLVIFGLLVLLPGMLWAGGSAEAPGPIDKARVIVTNAANINGRYFITDINGSFNIVWDRPANPGKTLHHYRVNIYSHDNALYVGGHNPSVTYGTMPNKGAISILRGSPVHYATKIAIQGVAKDKNDYEYGPRIFIDVGTDPYKPKISGHNPAVTESGKVFQEWYHGGIAVNFTASDDNTGTEIGLFASKIDSGSWSYTFNRINNPQPGNTIKERLSSLNGNPLSFDTTMMTSEFDGTWTITAIVNDNVGHQSDAHSFSLNIDNSPPDTIIANNIVAASVLDENRINISFNWEPVEDNPRRAGAPVYYNYSLKIDDDAVAHEDTNASPNPSHSVTLETDVDFERGNVYKFAVQAEDVFGISNRWSQFLHPIYIPSSPATVLDVLVEKIDDKLEPSLTAPKYKVKVLLDKPLKYLYIKDRDPSIPAFRDDPQYALKGIRFFCDGEEKTTVETFLRDHIATASGDEPEEEGWFIHSVEGENEGRLAYFLILEGDAYSHHTPTFTVNTCYPDYLGGVEESMTYEYYNLKTYNHSLSNYPAWLRLEILELTEEPGNRTVLDRVEITPEWQKKWEEQEEHLMASVELDSGSTNIGLRLAKVFDLEGDDIQYKLVPDLESEMSNEIINFTNLPPEVIVLPEKDSKTFSIAYEEINNDGIPPDPDFLLPFQNSIYVTLNIDTGHPSFAAGEYYFTYDDADETSLPTRDGITLTAQRDIVLRNVKVLNGEKLFVRVDGGEATEYTVIPGTGIIGEGINVPITLPAGDGEKNVIMYAVTGADNRCDDIILPVTLDTTDPAVPDDGNGLAAFHYNHSDPGSEIELILPEDNGDIREYRIGFGGVLQDITIPVNKFAQSISVSTVSPNTLIHSEVVAVDYVDRESVVKPFEMYTIPVAGSLGEDYEQDITNLRWSIDDPGICTTLELRQVNADNSDGPLAFFANPTDPWILLENLATKIPYRFKLYSLNAPGYKVPELDNNGKPLIYHITMGNNKPVWNDAEFNFYPEPFEYEGTRYLTDKFTFSWDPAFDADSGEMIYYMVQYEAAGSGSWTDLTGWQEETKTSIQEGLFFNNRAYRLRVLVRDQYMDEAVYTDSSPVQFLTDSMRPSLDIARSADVVPVITLSTSDDGSGVFGAFCTLRQEGVAVLSDITINDDNIPGIFTGIIDIKDESITKGLEDGLYTLDITAVDNTTNQHTNTLQTSLLTTPRLK